LAANALGKSASYHGNPLFIKGGGYGFSATTERRNPNSNGDHFVVYLDVDGEKLHQRRRAQKKCRVPSEEHSDLC
jgi:hypothetical protein